MNNSIKYIYVFTLLFICAYSSSSASQVILNADFRHRPPELIVKDNKLSGPLKDILEEAASKIGAKIKWRHAHFSRSITEIKSGTIDIIPKTFKTTPRKKYIKYLGPLFTRVQVTKFLVKKGHKDYVNKYSDLKKYKVGVKRASFYYTKFNNDKKISKIESYDDYNMSHMFIKDRFKVMAVIDPIAIEQELRKRNFEEYEYANYSHTRRMGLYYAFSKKSKHYPIASKLNRELLKMKKSGRVSEIYSNHKLSPTLINKVLIADFRHRPPEMTVEGDKLSGPLKEILDTAANRAGYSIKWSVTPFSNSLKRLRTGFVDLVPRTIKTKDRAKYVKFLGPIGYFRKDIHFLVRKGKENSILKYNDLRKYKVGIKRGTHYFNQFQNDASITKIESVDDDNMSHMFIKNRFDVMAVLDPLPLVEALHSRGFTKFSFAKYKHNNDIGIYYAFSKKSNNKNVFKMLNRALLEMYNTGEIVEIFKKHNVVPPLSK